MTDPPVQLTRADLKHMTPEEIEAARRAGRLDKMLGVPPAQIALRHKATSGERLTRDDLRGLLKLGQYDQIIAAHEHGRIITGGSATTPKGEDHA